MVVLIVAVIHFTEESKMKYLRRIKFMFARFIVKKQIFSNIYHFLFALSGGICYTLHS